MKKQLLSCLALALALTAGAQITLVKDINDGSSDSNPNDSYTFNGKTYFQADDSSGVNTGGIDYGDELWVTDGTTGGTMLFKNIRGTEDTGGGSTSSQPEGFFEYNGSLYLSANTDAGSQLFKLNATEDDLDEVTGVPGFNNSCELGGLIYFVYEPGPSMDNLLYVFDGTNAAPVTNNSLGTLGTEDIINNTANISHTRMVAYNNKIYFVGTMTLDNASGDPNTDVGAELYSYEPATGEFALVKDIAPGSINGTTATGGNIACLNVVNGALYFKADTSNFLYQSDGTEVGTIPVATATTAGLDGVLSLYLWNDKLYFEGDNGSADGNGNDQLWVYDPVADTVTELSNEDNNHDPRYYAGVGADLFYVGRNASDNDWHVYRLKNGTDLELIAGTNDLDCEWLFELNGKLYFEGDDDGSAAAYGTELYELDPTTLSASDVRLKGIAAAYPNPAKDYITVDKSLVNGAYSIYDVTGKAVKQGVLQSQKINLNLNTGFYIFKAQTDSGFYTQKLIVK